MAARAYIRPVGRLGPSIPAGAAANALAIAGRSDLLFAAAELIERGDGAVRRHVVMSEALLKAGQRSPKTAAILQHLRRPRSPVAGVMLDQPRIMGIVNVTPDSFSDGGRYFAPEAAIEHGLRLESEGADILDVGGESTRPGAEPIAIEEECRRVLPVIEGLVHQARVPISIDTRNAEVMRRAAHAGARLINDVSALTHDPHSLPTARDAGLPVVLMHARGDPRTMQRNPRYDDVVLDVYDALHDRIEACETAGIPRERLIVDPGIGFGKTMQHNLALLGSLSIFHGLGCPVLLGASRKSFIGKLTGVAGADRLPGSLAAAMVGAAQGVQILRVHDVAATRQALALSEGCA